MFIENDAKEALLAFAKIDKEKAKLLEKIMRLETAHFKSKQYQLTGSAGMESGAWGKYLGKYFPNGYQVITMADNQPKLRGKKYVQFIKWDNVFDFLTFLSDYIDRKKGDYACWNSLNESRKAIYRDHINSIKNRIIQ